MRRLAVAIAGAVLALPGVANAQGGAIELFGPGTRGLRVIRDVSMPVSVSGRLSVPFHGDPADCAGEGLCDTSGTVTWSPVKSADLTLTEYVLRGRRHVDGALFLDSADPTDAGAAVRATVNRGTNGTCADVGFDQDSVFDLSGTARSAELDLAGQDLNLVGTRCAGPVEADIENALPTTRVPTRALERGGLTLDLTGSRPFAAHGLTGTVDPSIRLRIGRPIHQRPVPAGLRVPEPPIPHQRVASLDFSVTSVAGRVTVPFAASSDHDLCAALDACGLTGSETLFPSSHSGTGSLLAIAPFRRPRRDLLAALGLSRSGNPAGIQMGGFFTWRPDAGTTSAAVDRPGGPPCEDTVRLGQLGFSVSRRRGGFEAVLARPNELSGQDPLRTRCPGPAETDMVGAGGLATGMLPPSAFASPTVAIHLDRGANAAGPLFSGGSEPDVTIVLHRRGGLREQTIPAR